MQRRYLVLGAIIICGGAWLFFQHYRIAGLDHLEFKPLSSVGGPQPEVGEPVAPPVDRTSGTVRIASFHIQAFGNARFSQPRVMNILAETVRRFDVMAIQGVQAQSNDVVPRFVELINSTGRHYDYVIGPRLGRGGDAEQYAIIFDGASIEVDRAALYTVHDPDDVLHREPLVAWFRVRGPLANQAFTFTLIDFRIDADQTAAELPALANVYRAVRDDGRGEDDVILLGDLNVDDQHLGRVGDISQIMPVISGLPTNTRGDKQFDNMLFSKMATTEFTGRSGVFDLIREFNLTTEDALSVSDHMPIWAEFSIYEGGQGGRMATKPADGAK
jgi:endonuclease/exonuclease/phosphatase family metal-dependent hydrolase